MVDGGGGGSGRGWVTCVWPPAEFAGEISTINMKIHRLVPGSFQQRMYHAAEILACSFIILPSASYAVDGQPSSSIVPVPLPTRTRCTRSTERFSQPYQILPCPTKPPLPNPFARIPTISHIHNVILFGNTAPQNSQAVGCTTGEKRKYGDPLNTISSVGDIRDLYLSQWVPRNSIKVVYWKEAVTDNPSNREFHFSAPFRRSLKFCLAGVKSQPSSLFGVTEAEAQPLS